MLHGRAIALHRDHINAIIFHPARSHPITDTSEDGWRTGLHLRQGRPIDRRKMREPIVVPLEANQRDRLTTEGKESATQRLQSSQARWHITGRRFLLRKPFFDLSEIVALHVERASRRMKPTISRA